MSRILYIEDNFSNRILVRRVLEADGFEMYDAENATDGIALAARVVPDLILMDLSMPDLDGLDATRRMRDIPQLKGVPIVALTANVMKDERQRALEVCDGFIPKPIDVDTFPTLVRRYLRSER